MKENESKQRLYCVFLETISDPEFTCNDENNNPWIFTSEVDAWKNIAEDKIIELTQVILGQREYDETLFDFDMNVVEVRLVGREIIGVTDGFTILHRIHDDTGPQFWSYDEKPF